MNLLSVNNLAKSYGERVLFQNISFGLSQGSRVALIARNGTGKTSLLKILAGTDTPDSGDVVLRKGIRIGYLPQDPDFDKESTVLDTLFSTETPLVKAIREYELSIAQEDVETMQTAMEKIDQLNGWDYEARAKQILSVLKITNFDQKVKSLSGGQLKRLALAHLLLDSPDLIILDEPTNHLDIGMVEWLEDQLNTAKTTLLMVTHDRYFLNNVCNEILEIEDQQLYRYKGNYEYFLEKREERHQANAASLDKAKNLFKKELEWMRRQPKARTGKSKSRIDSFHDIKKVVKGVKREGELTIEAGMERLGSKVLELHNVGKSFGDKTLFKKINYKFTPTDRVGLVGENGSGKSTLIKIMTGEEPPTTGKVVLGDTVVFGYYSQDGLTYKPNQRVIEVLTDIAENVPSAAGGTRTAAQMLELFLFPPKMHYVQVEKLSGGEKRRLYLLTILMQNPNFLILDEPTNDLDILTINILEEYLKGFKGCLLVVSHDRFFMDKLVEHVFVFRSSGEFKDYPGNYSRYRAWEAIQQEEKELVEKTKNSNPEKSKPVNQTKVKTKLSYNEQREFEQLSQSIEQLEKEKAELTEKLNAGGGSHDELQELAVNFEKIKNKLDEQELRWLELSEFAN